jgi:decaprenyl-phosphate phosphoribosyltransferase
MQVYFSLIRIHHWIKNSFIIIPLFFSGQLFYFEKIIIICQAVFGFCLVTGFVYIVNDILDLEFDKIHPQKRLRPLASNVVSIKKAIIIGFLILSAGLLILFSLNKNAFLLTCFYVFMNILYSLVLKKIPIIDFIIVSIGFVIRIYIGGIIAGVELSEWIVLMVFLLSLLIAISKRRDDLIILEETKKLNRDVIKEYSIYYLDNILSIVSSILLVSYLMYVTNDDIKKMYDSNLIYLTFIFVLSGVFRYLQLSIVYKKAGSPIKIFYSDYFLQSILFLWMASFFIIIY